MNKKLPLILGGALTILLLVGVVSATVVHAQDGTPPTPPAGERGPGGRGPHFGSLGMEAAAKALGMTADELSAALKDGKTFEELASAAGVDLQTVQEAIKAAQKEELRSRIEAGLEDGTLSQEKADWLLEGLDKGFLDGPGFGFGIGPLGPRPDQVPPSDTSDV